MSETPVHEPVDRTGWPEGPWSQEPDRFEFKHAGFQCLLNRNRIGCWCGYCALPSGHPWHGKDYSDIEVDVHGGLTYAGFCQGDICHVPLPGESDNVWWQGFDLCHGGDLVPRCAAEGEWAFSRHQEYRTLQYAMAQTKSLAEQAREAQYSTS